MLTRVQGHEVVVEDLVLMVVNCDVLSAVVLRCEEAVVGAWWLESILEDNDTVLGEGSLIAVAIAVELFDGAKVQARVERRGLIEQLDTNDDIIVGGCAVFGLHIFENVEGSLNGVALSPCQDTTLAGVVKAVLRAGRTVQVDHDLETGLSRPADGLVEVWSRAGDERSAAVVVGPVADGNADDVETGVGNLLEIGQSSPGLPVVLEDLLRGLVTKLLAKGVFVDDAPANIVRFEDGRRDPWLKDQPTANVDTSNLCLTPNEVCRRARLGACSDEGDAGSERCQRVEKHVD